MTKSKNIEIDHQESTARQGFFIPEETMVGLMALMEKMPIGEGYNVFSALLQCPKIEVKENAPTVAEE